MSVKARNRNVTLLAVCALLFFFLPGCSNFRYSPNITQTDIVIENYYPSISNSRVVTKDVTKMAYCNGKLYFCYQNSPSWNSRSSKVGEYISRVLYDYESYSRRLLYIEDGEIITIGDVGETGDLFGSYGDYLYFLKVRPWKGGTDEAVCSYNTKTNTTTELVINDFPSRIYYDFTNDGVLRIEDPNDSTYAYHIKDDSLLGRFPTELSSKTVRLGENVYTFKDCKLYCNGNDISDEIPCFENAVFHSMEDGALLTAYTIFPDECNCYYIAANGEITQLLPEMDYEALVGCFSVYRNYVFMSLERYNVGIFETNQKYKDDTMSGTYRIDIRDFSRIKISDKTFTSMYIFDETGIFGNNVDGNYKIDFDGNPLLTIVEG